MTKADKKTSNVAKFLAALKASEFLGDIHEDVATRTVMATDNSVYELLPAAVVFPRKPDDLNVIARLASEYQVAIVARGGGTGTNGQSLTESVIVDCSRFLTEIEYIDVAEGYAVVQPGVILDDLNRAAAAHGLFFAPTVSTASRATIGGMAATDASGKGSRIYGRTSDHVQEMELALIDGSSMHVKDAEFIDEPKAGSVRQNAISQLVKDIATEQADAIARVFPKMNRSLTGYNLDQAFRNDQVSLIKLFCGSEGTLALTKRLKVSLLPKPRFKALLVVAYDNTLEALADVRRLAQAEPTAIEFIDDKILTLAQQDPVWEAISGVLESKSGRDILGLNFVEVQSDDIEQLQAKITGLEALSSNQPASLVEAKVVSDSATIAALWSLRSKCVGLLGRMDPTRQGTAFVEDAAVPPENLVDFVTGFRRILDEHGLVYGMFGHADVGCVHVRPALDMRQSGDASMIRVVSDAVHKLAHEQGGLIWGEHGKGFRGEFGPDVFGKELYRSICRIKREMDPDNLLNPGKIASLDPERDLIALDEPVYRGTKDAAISKALSDQFAGAIKCNGNGQCFNRDFDDAMCPSYKASADRRYSPKGRAALLRSWMRARSNGRSESEISEIEAELHDSLEACLSCKACTSQCPIKVDIPQMRSQFYEAYYRNRRRPLRHHLYAFLENVGPIMTAFPRISNFGLRLFKPALAKLGLVELPKVNPSAKRIRRSGGQKVVLVEDSFLATFDGKVIDACEDVLTRLGFEVLRSGFLATGKPLHVIGQKEQFARVSGKSLERLARWDQEGIPLVSIEPAFSSMFQHEYQKLAQNLPKVASFEAFVSQNLPHAEGKLNNVKTDAVAVPLFLHCSETASKGPAGKQWAEIFSAFGLRSIPQNTGCCGMAGMFGHEARNLDISQRAFENSWSDKLNTLNGLIAATGFSCRCQVQRFSNKKASHPAEVLVQLISAQNA